MSLAGEPDAVGICYVLDMRPHSRNLVLQMLDKAKAAVADVEKHLRAQEALLIGRTARADKRQSLPSFFVTCVRLSPL